MSFIDFDAPTNIIRRDDDLDDTDNIQPLNKRVRLDRDGDDLDREELDNSNDTNNTANAVDDIFKSIDDPDAVNDDGAFDALDTDEQPKQKRVMAKIDPERLLGPNGLPALMQQSQHWRFKGKGHESEDLRKLLSLYQFWSHKLFPKIQFSDVIDKTEKICHQRRMEAALKGWKDAKGVSALEQDGATVYDGLEREAGVDNDEEGNQEKDGESNTQARNPDDPPDALFRSPSPPNQNQYDDDIPDDIPPDDEMHDVQQQGIDSGADRDALEEEALAALEKELGGF